VEPRTDARGGAFYSFAVDARHGVRGLAGEEGWRRAAIAGCVYVDGQVFVEKGPRHRPAAFLLGKKLEPVDAHVCRAATPAS
jgi:hypothetical protein